MYVRMYCTLNKRAVHRDRETVVCFQCALVVRYKHGCVCASQSSKCAFESQSRCHTHPNNNIWHILVSRSLSPFHFTVLSEICVAVSKLLHCTEICFSLVLITQSRTNVFILIKFQNLCNVAEKLISKLVFLIKFK